MRDRRILIVDDEPSLREGLAKTLRRPPHAYEVETACDGFEAVAKADEFLPDLVILDLIMPGMDGVEACGRIRRKHPSERTKVMILTGYPGNENAERSLLADADLFLPKPLPIARLLAHVAELLDRGDVSRTPD